MSDSTSTHDAFTHLGYNLRPLMSSASLFSAAHAAQLDTEPLNPVTGLCSTRGLYEVPKRGAVGADGPAGAFTRPPS